MIVLNNKQNKLKNKN